MSSPSFHNFDASHLAVLIATFALPLFLAWVALRTRSQSFLRAVARGLSLALVGSYFAYLVHQNAASGLTLAHSLPMQLCDWALFATVAALLTRNRHSFELAYFWGLGGTLQAIVTPNLSSGFPSFSFINFFTIHCGIVIGVLFMILAMHLRPYPASLFRILLWTEGYLACTLAVNALTGANYGFLSRRPAGSSLLDFLSDTQPLYVLEMNALAVLFFIVLYLPFLVADGLRSFGTAPDLPSS